MVLLIGTLVYCSVGGALCWTLRTVSYVPKLTYMRDQIITIVCAGIVAPS
jgi:hypothetical protein